MDFLEQTEKKLVLRFRSPIWFSSLFSSAFVAVGLIFALFGLAIQADTTSSQLSGVWIAPMGLGILMVIAGITTFSKFTKSTLLELDQAQNSLVWQHQTLRGKATEIIEFSLDLISGVMTRQIKGPVSTEGMSDTSTGVCLILAPLHLRLQVYATRNSQTALAIAQKLARFLNVTYFKPWDKPPLPKTALKEFPNAEKAYIGWKGTEELIEDLQQYLEQNPHDADMQRALGIVLHRQNRRSKQAIMPYLERAETLYQAQGDLTNAALSRVLQGFVSLNYRDYLREVKPKR